jgi:hypothetical protein
VTFELARTTPADAPVIARFLSQVFQLPPAAPLVDARHMFWKYWAPRPDWTGSRSFIARHGDIIAAHAAAWPVRIRAGGQVVSAAHLIDWAADPSCPGAGVWLLRQLRARTPGLIATGGSDITRKILPIVGFERHGELHWFARPLRPVRLALTTRARGWRLPPRLARNLLWRQWPPLRLPRHWSASPLEPEELPDRLWPAASATTAVTLRDARFYRYFVDATAARHRLFGIARDGRLRGYFCLAFAPGVARVADLWIQSDDVADWRRAFQTAASTAAADARVYEVTACAATPVARQALEDAGFHWRESVEVSTTLAARPADTLALHVQMLDSDASFLSQDPGQYLTC